MAATAKNFHRINVWPDWVTAQDAARDTGGRHLGRMSVYDSTTEARANTAWVPIGRATAPRRPIAQPEPVDDDEAPVERTVPRRDKK